MPTEAEASVGRSSNPRNMPLTARRLRPAGATLAVPASVPATTTRLRDHDRIVLVPRQRLLAAQLDLSLAVDPDHLYQNRVALVDDVLDALDAPFLQLRDVDEAVLAGRDLDEGAKRHHPPDRALVDAADLRVLGDGPNDLPGSIAVGTAEGRDPNLSRVLDVDLGPGLGADLLDHLAARSDHFADLVGIDHHDVDPRSVRRQLGPRLGDRRIHDVEEMHPRLPRLFQGVRHQLIGNARDLDVHLERGHARARPGHLEVHVAEVILDSLDVGQDRDVLALLDQPHRHSGDVRLDRHAGVHEREAAATDGRHRGGPVRFEDVGDDSDRVREVDVGGNQRLDRSLGQRAMPDLAPAGPTEGPHFADAVGWEVVVEHVALPA